MVKDRVKSAFRTGSSTQDEDEEELKEEHGTSRYLFGKKVPLEIVGRQLQVVPGEVAIVFPDSEVYEGMEKVANDVARQVK